MIASLTAAIAVVPTYGALSLADGFDAARGEVGAAFVPGVDRRAVALQMRLGAGEYRDCLGFEGRNSHCDSKKGGADEYGETHGGYSFS